MNGYQKDAPSFTLQMWGTYMTMHVLTQEKKLTAPQDFTLNRWQFWSPVMVLEVGHHLEHHTISSHTEDSP